MPLSTLVKELSESERRLQLKGQLLKRFIIRKDGSVGEHDAAQQQGRVTKDHVLAMKGFCLSDKQTAPFPDREVEKRQYWSVVRDYLKEQEWVRESEHVPLVANADTFAAVMIMPFQFVPMIHAWKDNGVIFLMKAKGRDVNGVKHSRMFDKEKHQKSLFIRSITKREMDQEDEEEKMYKLSKVSLGEDNLICVSEVEALNENDHEVKVNIRRDFESDERKKDKFYRYVYPRLVTTAAVRQISSLILVTKDEDDCVKETMCLHKIKQMMDVVKKSPCKISWTLQKSVTFLHRFVYMVREEMDDAEDHEVFTFWKESDKKQVMMKKEKFDSSQLTGAGGQGNDEDDDEDEDEENDDESHDEEQNDDTTGDDDDDE